MNIALARVSWTCYQKHKQEKNNHINWTSSNFGTSKNIIKKIRDTKGTFHAKMAE